MSARAIFRSISRSALENSASGVVVPLPNIGRAAALAAAAPHSRVPRRPLPDQREQRDSALVGLLGTRPVFLALRDLPSRR